MNRAPMNMKTKLARWARKGTSSARLLRVAWLPKKSDAPTAIAETRAMSSVIDYEPILARARSTSQANTGSIPSNISGCH